MTITPFPNKKYKIILADPPWEYFLYKKQDSGSTANKHYDTLNIDEIKKLPIQKITDDDCILFLWGTWPNLQECLDVIKAWGFKYKTIGFNWIKTNPTNAKCFFGMGHYTKSNSEFCLIATKGKTTIINNKISSIIHSSIQKHSKKPDIVRQKIVQLCGDLPRIELFARTRIHNWDTWGNDEKLNNQPLEAFTNA